MENPENDAATTTIGLAAWGKTGGRAAIMPQQTAEWADGCSAAVFDSAFYFVKELKNN